MLLDEIRSVTTNSGKSEVRKFGLSIGTIFGMVAIYLFWQEKEVAQLVAYTGVAFFAVGWLLPVALKPVYITWMCFAVLMGFIMTKLILFVLYSLVFTPAGLMLRLLGKDPLKERIEPTKTTYWIQRERGALDPKSLENQY